jgi:hypothetical protein
MDSGNVEGFEKETRFIAARGVERAPHTVREHFQKGRVYELSECLVAGPVGRLFIRNFANLRAGAFCKFTIGLIAPKTLSP